MFPGDASVEATAENFPEYLSETLTTQAVDDEVHGRINREQSVRKLPDSLHQVSRLHVTEAEHRGHDGVRSDTQHKHENHHDQHERDAVAGAHLLALDALFTQGLYDAGVDDDEEE